MAADGNTNGKGKTRKDREVPTPDAVLGPHDLEDDDLEVIPTAVPVAGDGYEAARDSSGAMMAGLIGEAGRILSEEDLRRVNTRRGLIQLVKSKNIDL
ncbi:MAG TPA: hypothetical protein PKL10_11045, partial [Nitrospira sp.]|nr:hypothetical protein [Nitrospira sp.]